MKKTITTIGLLAVSSLLSQAAVSYTGVTISETFTGYDGNSAPTGWDASGFSNGAGFSENRGSSSGGVTTGGTYAFDIGSGNIALGVQPGGSDFTPGTYDLEVTNDSGATVDTWAIAFNSYVFNDQGRGNGFNFSYSTDGSSYTPVAAGSFTSAAAADGSPAWAIGAAYSDNISASVASGGSLHLRWTGVDAGGSGSRDEFALDDVSINAVPEPSSIALLGLGGIALLRRRR